MQSSGEPVSGAWSLPGTQHRSAPQRPSKPPFTIGGVDADRIGVAAPRPAAAADTVGRQAFDQLVKMTADQCENRSGRNPHLTQEGAREDDQNFAAARSTAPIVNSVVARESELRAEYQQGLASLSAIPRDAAAQLEAQRVWSQEHAKLEGQSTEGEKASALRSAIGAAVHADDPTRLAVLMTDGKSYLESKGVSTDWLADAVADEIPEVTARRDRANSAAQLVTTIKTAAKLVEAGLESGTPPVSLEKLRPAVERLDPDAHV
jgi:hypothetical protein